MTEKRTRRDALRTCFRPTGAFRDLAGALAIANASYFNPTLPMPNASTKIINMMRGQGEALCQLSELIGHDKNCWNALEVFKTRVRDVVLRPKQTEWTFNRTLSAFNAGL